MLRALASRPRVAANTVVVFTSDHGEYGASHGLRGKGAGAYEEAIRVPLIVKDPRGKLTGAPSSRAQPAQLERRHRAAAVDDRHRLSRGAATPATPTSRTAWTSPQILANPDAPGRPYVLHATDETVTEFATEQYAASAPLHVVALRTPDAKHATYSNWSGEQMNRCPPARSASSTTTPRIADAWSSTTWRGAARWKEPLSALLASAYEQELRRPLPHPLRQAAGRGLFNYFTVAKRIAARATAHRAERDALALKAHSPTLKAQR